MNIIITIAITIAIFGFALVCPRGVGGTDDDVRSHNADMDIEIVRWRFDCKTTLDAHTPTINLVRRFRVTAKRNVLSYLTPGAVW